MDWVDRFKELQSRNEQNNAQFAAWLDIPRSTLHSIYSNRNQPSQHTLDRICAHLRITEIELRYDNDELHKLTDEQYNHLMAWNKLPEEKKRILSDLITLLL